MQNHGSGNLVDYAAVLLARLAGFVEELVGLVRREAFIPQVNWKAGQFTQRSGESLHLFCLRADLAVEGQGIPDHDS